MFILDKHIEETWPETVELMQSLIKAFPYYENKVGVAKASNVIRKYLKKNKLDFHELTYTNAEFKNHELYVQVEDLDLMFVNDSERTKKNWIIVIDTKRPGKNIILNGHYDVDCVSTPEQWAEEDGWKSGKVHDNYLYGRGATDMLAGFCSLLQIVKILNSQKGKLNGKIIFTGVSDEEIGGNGSLQALLWLKKNNYLDRNTYALIAEPSDDRVCLESLGFLHLTIEAQRKSIHMGVSQEQNNSLYDIINIIRDFDLILKLAINKIGCDSELSKVKFNWGIISGGTDAAIPLGFVSCKGVIFLSEKISNNKFKKTLGQEIRRYSKGVAVIKFSSFEFVGAKCKPNPVSTTLLKSDLFPKNHIVSEGIFPSPCDARLFKAFSIPVVIYGPGSLKQAHSINEHIYLPSVKQFVKHTIRSITYLLTND